jgi:hypothetical protein
MLRRTPDASPASVRGEVVGTLDPPGPRQAGAGVLTEYGGTTFRSTAQVDPKDVAVPWRYPDHCAPHTIERVE